MVKSKPEVWFELLSYFGIDHAFPSENLYEHTVGHSKNIVLMNSGLHGLMQHKKKFKFDVVNLGLNIFQKNQPGKADCGYRIMQEAIDVLLPYLDETR